MLRVRVLREHDELPLVVGPIAEWMEVERAPHRGRLRRGLDPREGIGVTHTPPTLHDDLHARRNSRAAGPYTGYRRGMFAATEKCG